MIHIDFGFMLGASPKQLGFESAPFKLTREFLDLLGGENDVMWDRFRHSVVQGFQALNKERHRQRLERLMRVSILDVPGKTVMIRDFLDRLARAAKPEVALTLIRESLHSTRTSLYDHYQRRVNNILD